MPYRILPNIRPFLTGSQVSGWIDPALWISGLALRENLPFRVKSNYIDRRVSGHLKAMKQLRAIGTSVLYMLVMNDPTPLHQDVGNKFFLQGLPQFTDKREKSIAKYLLYQVA